MKYPNVKKPVITYSDPTDQEVEQLIEIKQSIQETKEIAEKYKVKTETYAAQAKAAQRAIDNGDIWKVTNHIEAFAKYEQSRDMYAKAFDVYGKAMLMCRHPLHEETEQGMCCFVCGEKIEP